MSSTFSTRKVALDEIAARLQRNRRKLITARDNPADAESDLDAMASKYGSIITDINTAAANPDDAAAQAQKAEADKLLAEYNAVKAIATGMKGKVSDTEI